jgi:UDP-GlcNAc:undecaprenyl-phosphate GlcNAc-1-phosphate transferase
MTTYLSSFLIAFSITVNLLFVLQHLAQKIGLVDKPNHRKHHSNEVPLIGGIAMFCGFILAVLLLEQPLSGLRSLFAGTFILMIVGVLDDFRELTPRARFIAEILAALLISVGGGVLLRNFGAIGFNMEDVTLRGIVALPLTIVAIVGVINALNMSDGIDGLAGGLTFITLSALAWITWMEGLHQQLWLLILLIAVVIAFLSFNLRFPGRPQALVFMGDAGTMFLGFILAWFMINLSQGSQRAMTPVTALWIFALPLLDTLTIMLRRILNGYSPFAADRKHLHHLLLNNGFSVPQTLSIILGLAAGLAFLGLLGLYVGIAEATMFRGFLILFAIYLISMMVAWQELPQGQLWLEKYLTQYRLWLPFWHLFRYVGNGKLTGNFNRLQVESS